MKQRSFFTAFMIVPLSLMITERDAQAESSHENTVSHEITAEFSPLTPLGGGLYLQSVPPQFVFVMETLAPAPQQAEWVRIPATYETLSETVEVEPARETLKIIRAGDISDGASGGTSTDAIDTLARAEVFIVPAVIREQKRRVVKTPARWVERILPDMRHPKTIRKKVRDDYYIVRDGQGNIVQEFASAKELALFLNAR